jgi:tripartite-type tricarboxylate transporter receptor subunit TctC
MPKLLLALSLLMQILVGGHAALAQTYPTKVVRVVVPYPPGGSADGIIRPLAQRMTELLGQPVIVDNRAGANGVVGAEVVAHSAPDGYTILLGAIGPNAVMGLLQPLPYDPGRDFAPLAFLAGVTNVLVVSAASPYKSVADVVAAAKARPGQLGYGSTGNGSSNQLAAELFKLSAGVNILHVPYKGGAAMQTDLLGGHIAILFDNVPAALPQIRAGSFRALAITSLQRHADLPDVPTMEELGFPKFETGAWYGLFLPAGTPRPIVEQLNAVVNRALGEAALRDRLRSQGFDLNPGSADQFGEFVVAERNKWRRVIDAAGIKAQ